MKGFGRFVSSSSLSVAELVEQQSHHDCRAISESIRKWETSARLARHHILKRRAAKTLFLWRPFVAASQQSAAIIFLLEKVRRSTEAPLRVVDPRRPGAGGVRFWQFLFPL